jgi:hypothetical protein
MPRLFTKFATRYNIGIGFRLFISKILLKFMEVECRLRTILIEKELLLHAHVYNSLKIETNKTCVGISRLILARITPNPIQNYNIIVMKT